MRSSSPSCCWPLAPRRSSCSLSRMCIATLGDVSAARLERNGAITTFRDALGRITGTPERMLDGSSVFRDAQGRLTGSSE